MSPLSVHREGKVATDKHKPGVKLSSFKALKSCLLQTDSVYCKQYDFKRNGVTPIRYRNTMKRTKRSHPKKIPSIIYRYVSAHKMKAGMITKLKIKYHQTGASQKRGL